MTRFQGKVVLITGAGVGIGRAAAVRFAREGAKVAVNSLTPAHGAETLRLLQEAGGEGIYVQGDVSQDADARRIVGETVKVFGRLDVLVNNAGIVLPGRIDNTSEEDWDRTMAVNLKGPFLVSKYAIAEMRKAGGGVIVNNASVAAIKGVKDRAAYTASKGGPLGPHQGHGCGLPGGQNPRELRLSGDHGDPVPGAAHPGLCRPRESARGFHRSPAHGPAGDRRGDRRRHPLRGLGRGGIPKWGDHFH